MTLISEKIAVTAREFLNDKNINDCQDFNEPMYQAKLQEFDWDLQFCSATIGCELVWKIAIGRNRVREWRQLDRLFSPSPIGTHANFRGCRAYKTGNIPELGAIVIWKRGNSWQGHAAIVIWVSEDKMEFDVIDCRILEGSENRFLRFEEKKSKKVGLPFRNDKLNLVGFIYAPLREID